MKVAVVGPLCEDVNIYGNEKSVSPGGVTYYTGSALQRLGVNTTVVASFKPGHTWDVPFDIHPVAAEDTIRFENEYPDPNDPNFRVQRAYIADNIISSRDIPANMDFYVLGPLYHNNIEPGLIASLPLESRVALAPQGLLRHLDGDRIVLKDPGYARAILLGVDYLFLDKNELEFMADLPERNAVDFMMEIGTQNLIVTRGSHGSTLYLEGEEFSVRAFPISTRVYSTGAGDSYMAGFIGAIAHGISNPIEIGEFAAMTASIAISSPGPFNSTYEKVLEMLSLQ